MKVTVHDGYLEKPVAMVSPSGDLMIKKDDGKIFMLKANGVGVSLENLSFEGEADSKIRPRGTKLIYPGDKITIEF